MSGCEPNSSSGPVPPSVLSVCRKLSQVLHAVAALLYPFTWQHTFISIVPEILIDVVMAPTPYLLGVQKRLLDQVLQDQSDVSPRSEGATSASFHHELLLV